MNIRWWIRRVAAVTGAALLTAEAAGTLTAQRVVCLNDQSIVYQDHEMRFLDDRRKGSVTVLDFSRFPPGVSKVAEVPVSVVGPPTSVAVTPDQRKAIVTGAMDIREASDGELEHVPGTAVSLLDLDTGQVLDRVSGGMQPSGVSIAADGRTAYVVNRAEGTVSIYSIEESTLREVTRVAVAEPADSLSHIETSPDGKYAAATLTERGQILLLDIKDEGGLKVLDRIAHGKKPYAARVFPEGDRFAVADIENDRVAIFVIRDKTLVLESDHPVGRLPEGIDISADGAWIAVSCFEGGNLTDADHPTFGQPAKIYLFRRSTGGKYVAAGELELEGVPQFAVFSPDGRHLVVSETSLQRIAIFRREGYRFVDAGVSLPVPGEPVAAGR